MLFLEDLVSSISAVFSVVKEAKMPEQTLKNALVHLITFEAVKIREPRPRFQIPFQLDLERLDVIPAVRELVLDIVLAQLVSKDFGVVCSSKNSCRSLAPLIANYFSMPFLLPDKIPARDREVIGLYGKLTDRAPVLLVEEFAKDAKGVEDMAHVLSLSGYQLARVLVLFHADCELELQKACSKVCGGVEVEALFSVSMVLRILRDEPDFSQYISLDLGRIYDQYMQYIVNRESQS